MIICTQCHSNKNKPLNAPYVVYNSPTYMKFIITTNPLHVQMLSFLDIGIHIQSKDWGLSLGKIVNTSLLSNPLFDCATRLDALQSIEHLASSLRPLLSQNLTTYQPILSNICNNFLAASQEYKYVRSYTQCNSTNNWKCYITFNVIFTYGRSARSL